MIFNNILSGRSRKEKRGSGVGAKINHTHFSSSHTHHLPNPSIVAVGPQQGGGCGRVCGIANLLVPTLAINKINAPHFMPYKRNHQC